MKVLKALLVLLALVMVLVLSGCTAFQYEREGTTESLSGRTLFKSFKDIHAERDGFKLDIGESNVDAPDVSGDMVCIAKLQAGQECD